MSETVNIIPLKQKFINEIHIEDLNINKENSIKFERGLDVFHWLLHLNFDPEVKNLILTNENSTGETIFYNEQLLPIYKKIADKFCSKSPDNKVIVLTKTTNFKSFQIYTSDQKIYTMSEGEILRSNIGNFDDRLNIDFKQKYNSISYLEETSNNVKKYEETFYSKDQNSQLLLNNLEPEYNKNNIFSENSYNIVSGDINNVFDQIETAETKLHMLDYSYYNMI